MAISSLSILPTGMPVQAEMTSPTICESTHTRMSGASPCTTSSSPFNLASSWRNASGSMAGCATAAWPSPAAGCAGAPVPSSCERTSRIPLPGNSSTTPAEYSDDPSRFERRELVGLTGPSSTTLVLKGASRGAVWVRPGSMV